MTNRFLNLDIYPNLLVGNTPGTLASGSHDHTGQNITPLTVTANVVTVNAYTGNTVSANVVSGNTVTGLFQAVQSANVASAATINLETVAGNYVWMTGNVAVTSITLNQGHEREVYFSNTIVLTNSTNLVLLGNANMTTAVGDLAKFRGEAGGVVRMTGYVSANVHPGVPPFAGTDKQVQFNSNNALGASAGFTFDYTSNTLSVANTVCANVACVGTICANNLKFANNGSSSTYVLNPGDILWSANSNPIGTIPANGGIYTISAYPTLAATLGSIPNGYSGCNLTNICSSNSGAYVNTSVCCCGQTGTVCCTTYGSCSFYMTGTNTVITSCCSTLVLPSPCCVVLNYNFGYSAPNCLTSVTNTLTVQNILYCGGIVSCVHCSIPSFSTDCCCTALVGMGYLINSCQSCAGACLMYAYSTNGGCTWCCTCIPGSCLSASVCVCNPCVFSFNAGKYYHLAWASCGGACNIVCFYKTCDLVNWQTVDPGLFPYATIIPCCIGICGCNCLCYDTKANLVVKIASANTSTQACYYTWTPDLTTLVSCGIATCYIDPAQCNYTVISNGFSYTFGNKQTGADSCCVGMTVIQDLRNQGNTVFVYNNPLCQISNNTMCSFGCTQLYCCNGCYCYCCCSNNCCMWHSCAVSGCVLSGWICNTGNGVVTAVSGWLQRITFICSCNLCTCTGTTTNCCNSCCGWIGFACSQDLCTWHVSPICIGWTTPNVYYYGCCATSAFMINGCSVFSYQQCCSCNSCWNTLAYIPPYTYNTTCQFTVPCLTAQNGICPFIKT